MISQSMVRQSLCMVALAGVMSGAAFMIGGATVALWVLGASLILVGVFIVISWQRHREITRLSSEIDTVLHTGRRTLLSNCHEGDVAVLCNELNKMVAKLVRTAEQLKQEKSNLADALADVSHQIRTPLTAIELMLPLIEKEENPTQRLQMLRELEIMVDRTAWLVTTLLKMAKLDAGVLPVECKSVRVKEVVDRAVAPLELAMDLREVTLVREIGEELSYQGDALWSAEAIENVLKNCMEHTPAGGSVWVQAQEDALAVRITVRDTGKGIAEADLPHVFERFYRGCSEADSSAGFGIGLSLAKALIVGQGGTIRAVATQQQGAQFEITFPKVLV